MNQHHRFVVFALDGRRYALRLSTVERVVRIVAIDPLPSAPGVVLGVINVQGAIIPVVDVRKRFGLPEREPDLNDQLILSRTIRRRVALVVDAVCEVAEFSEAATTPANAILPRLDYLEGVMKGEDGLVIIHNLDTFLSFEEEETLETAMAAVEGQP